jgi:hypothetical protein
MATEDSPERNLRSRLLGERPDASAIGPDGNPLYPLGDSDPSYVAALEEYTKKETQFDAAEAEGGVRKSLQKSAEEDYLASSRITQAEMDKTLGIDDKMTKEDPDGKRMVTDAAGVGKEKRIRASAAKRLEADRHGDVEAAEDLLQRKATSRDEALALLGTYIDGQEMFDDTGAFIYRGETEDETNQAWQDYVEGRKKIGLPLEDETVRTRGPELDSVEQEALLRRTIKQGDKKANVRPALTYLANSIARAQKAYKDNPTDETKAALDSAVRLQSAAIEQYGRTPGALSPFMSSGDQGAMVNGTFVRTPDELVINTFGSEKVVDPTFPAAWNIDQYKDAAKVFENLAQPSDSLPENVREGVYERLGVDAASAPSRPAETAPPEEKAAYEEFQKKFYKARVEKYFVDILAQDGIVDPEKPADSAPEAEKEAYRQKKAGYDKEYAKRIQSFADARKGLDQVDDNEAYKVDGRAHEQISKIRHIMDVLDKADAIPKPSVDAGGQPYRRKSYTDEPGVVETTPEGKTVYLRQKKVPIDVNPKGFVNEKYILDDSGNPVDYGGAGTTTPPPTIPPDDTTAVSPPPTPPGTFLG